jgi:exodeoxyribonuclease VIII
MNDIMVDLETMDNTPSAAIVSIGAVQCDLTTGELGDSFYRVVDLEGQLEMGMTVSTETIYWWMGQGDGARQALLTPGKISLPQMCISFRSWLSDIDPSGERLRLWGNGASFDNAILRYAYAQVGTELHSDKGAGIKFWNDRDMRTVVGFYPRQLQEKWRRTTLRRGDHHNALDDAKHQVRYCSDILKDLGVKELY